MAPMTQIVRIVTNDRVYFVGEPLPVPEGCPVEPFLIQDIIWDEELDKIQFICFPDEPAAAKPPQKTEDVTEDQFEAMIRYHEQAKFAVAEKLLISATISAEHARIESVLTQDDYRRFLEEQAAAEEEPDEPDEPQVPEVQHTATQPAPAMQPEPEQDPPLPAELSVSEG